MYKWSGVVGLCSWVYLILCKHMFFNVIDAVNDNTLNYAFYVYIHENKGRILEIPP